MQKCVNGTILVTDVNEGEKKGQMCCFEGQV